MSHEGSICGSCFLLRSNRATHWVLQNLLLFDRQAKTLSATLAAGYKKNIATVEDNSV